MSVPVQTVTQDMQAQVLDPVMMAWEAYSKVWAMAKGRPTDYKPEVVARLLAEIAQGRTLHDICDKEEWAPTWTIAWMWAERHQAFSNALNRARVKQGHAFADMAVKCAEEAIASIQDNKGDNARVNAYKVKYEALKWRAGIYNPEYRDKQLHQHTGNVGVSLSISGLDAPRVIEGVKVEG